MFSVTESTFEEIYCSSLINKLEFFLIIIFSGLGGRIGNGLGTGSFVGGGIGAGSFIGDGVGLGKGVSIGVGTGSSIGDGVGRIRS